MKRHVVLLIMLMVSFLMFAQETITLEFTSRMQNGSYMPFDFVYVRDITHNWTEVLNYPDTTMVLTTYDSINEFGEEHGYLSEAYPNPFYGNTKLIYSTDNTQKIRAQLFLISGEMISDFVGLLEAGTHVFSIEMDQPQMAFFVVTSDNIRYVKKVLNTGGGNSNKIEINKITHIDPEKDRDVGDFAIGDLMEYEAVLNDEGNVISYSITQNQYSDEEIVFPFDINKPTVTTKQATNISRTTCTSGGYVTSDGGISITERGICWSTSHNPTLNDSRAIDIDGSSSYSITMTDLIPNTTYYVRAYAISRAGVSYGKEVRFTTTLLADIKILSIGNSYSADALAYVPFILENMNVNANIQIGILRMGGADLSNHVDNFENQASNYRYFHYNGSGAWQDLGQHTIQFALDNYDWDIIMLQQASNQATNWSTHQPTLDMLISLLENYVSSPVRFGWYMIQSRPATTVDGPNYPDETIVSNYTSIASNAQMVLDESACEFVVPVGTALQNARTIPAIKALGDYASNDNNTSGLGYLVADGVHLQEGLPCQIAAYSFVLSILEQYGGLETYSIIGETTRVTPAWIAEKNIPGPNGEPVGSNDANSLIGQQSAIEAFNNPFEITDMNR